MGEWHYRTGWYGPYKLPPDTVVDIEDPHHIADVIEECAEDFFSERDGFEAEWPRIFTLHASKDGPAIATMEVEVRSEPVFSASEVTQ